jgi:hypothetical protein
MVTMIFSFLRSEERFGKRLAKRHARRGCARKETERANAAKCRRLEFEIYKGRQQRRELIVANEERPSAAVGFPIRQRVKTAYVCTLPHGRCPPTQMNKRIFA